MLDEVKLSLRIKTNAFDEEITALIEAAKSDLDIAGVQVREGDILIRQAIKTYVKLNFGEPENPERLQKSYDSLKTRLQVAGDYRRKNGQKRCN